MSTPRHTPEVQEYDKKMWSDRELSAAKEHAQKTQLVKPLHELFSIQLVWDVPPSWRMVGRCWNAMCLGSKMG